MRIGIDPGSANTVVAVENRGIIFREPSFMAVNEKSKKIVATGEKAREILGKTDSEVVALYPIKDGVIADYEATEILLAYFLKKCVKLRMFKPLVVLSVPSRITVIEERAIKEAALSAGARDVLVAKVPLLAALGADLPVDKPAGHMVIDIGAGITDIGIISLGNLIYNRTVRTGGNKMDEAIIRYVRRVYNLVIGNYTAEEIKKKIGSAIPLDTSLSMEVKGLDLISSLPKSVTLTDEELRGPLEEFLGVLLEEIKRFLEKTPPELVADVIDNGILLTGGGSLLRGLEDRLSREIGVSIYIPEDSMDCVAKGTLLVKI